MEKLASEISRRMDAALIFEQAIRDGAVWKCESGHDEIYMVRGLECPRCGAVKQ